jgi:hypothetical protein
MLSAPTLRGLSNPLASSTTLGFCAVTRSSRTLARQLRKLRCVVGAVASGDIIGRTETMCAASEARNAGTFISTGPAREIREQSFVRLGNS